jgi:DNA-nicking Smr family endonuclease
LHGLCVEEAEKEVKYFLTDSLRKGHRCVKIIHGRGLRSPGGPVLKDALITWLSGRYWKNIIAFVTARQCDGGLGALYILLR